MSILSTVRKGKVNKPRRTLLYGVHGIGKSTFAAQFPKPLFLDMEGGLGDMDVESIDCYNDMGKAWQAILELGGDAETPYKTIIVDTIDWVERSIIESICTKAGKKSLADFDFGKGKAKVLPAFSSVLNARQSISNKYNILLLGHCSTVKVEPPDSLAYTRYAPKLMDDCAELAMEWADEVLFVNYKVNTRESDEGYGKKRSLGLGTGERVLYTSERPSHLAKNRLQLPDSMSFDFAEYSKYLA